MREFHRQELNAGIHRKKGCHPLYGKIFCAGCGRPYCRRITRAHNGAKEATWVCIDRFKGLRGEGCMNPIVKERNIMKAIKEKIGSDNLELVSRIEIGEDYAIRICDPQKGIVF